MLVIFPSFVICIILGFIIGSLLGYIKNYFWNTFVNLFLYASSSIPVFVIAPLLLVFSEYINWPTLFIDWEYTNIGATLNSLIIPIALICLVCGSYFTIQVKNATSTILGMQYIKLAKVKGMNTWIIYWKYVFANSLIKFLHSITILYSFVLSFSLIIERVFSIPGQSIILLNAFREKETYLVLYFIFSLVISVVIIQILIETFLIWLNPQYLINQQKFKWNIKTMFFKRRKNG
ncbi:ABC transporter permease subunit [Mycoplasmopsis sturni]|uniref:ABC transporter permease subunit n=1 Tax=Mycoplasmopsis sturni TaxID=39047 RepID=UPI0012ECB02E|nr:ABC transporter permease [Mycoplasmopsis sturni]